MNGHRFHIDVIGKTKIWFTISGIMILIGIIAMFVNGFNWGIDFTGGTIMEFKIGKPFDTKDIIKILNDYKVKDYQIQKIGTKGDHVSIKTSPISDQTRIAIIKEIEKKYNLTESDLIMSQQVGPSLGAEIRSGMILALVVASLVMLTYLGIRFNFEMSLAAVIGLLHNVFILISVYAVFRITVDSPFIAALLTVFSYSLHDTIVIFDRIRDNLKVMRRADYAEVANVSVNQTLVRSINVVLTVLIMLLLMYFLGPKALKDFALPLLIGITWGAYSSIFISTPLWVLIKNREKRKKASVKAAKA
ncbi:preprotein translocase subunit SecF [Caldanaerobacter subterraneus subsp. tengcongensis MB4]|uniref:Protein-export membrane protein SecF n=3 Tax=Caldanaerobacter subterraneus TaxID=911092 RepID=Q8RAM3_CALS4|nr:protein translocase subunit SecF [Caldanaerobacter subterraneus]AAM24420.1 Preprotein translocase subunit SecF [Caldanaerobacter subterraneus subsp. tengcongensis MB4]ERM92197.1 preprotein translocase subunit SecF [Caldanaerobacter subterraneus subsp. yonseiensis KB-1]KKC29785.1 preprotein translocase subunit SecF [Caldanaerobacter subterraneus subsp. pacificus DSM 12653]MCS3916025.1 preprotein translocase subunit SecF [Caldanaerobacter subterraneus subsp. tengcongensis MB4]